MEKVKEILTDFEEGIILMDKLVQLLIKIDESNELWVKKVKECTWSYLTGDYNKLDSELSPLLCEHESK